MPDSSPTPMVAAVPFLYPLDDFYARAGLPLPPFERLSEAEVPAPFRSLLVHDDDMTPTLEKFYGARIHLRILNRSQREDFYFREVVLHLDETERPVEFGANKVGLSLFPPKARQLILEERMPLGRILQDCDVPHVTRAKAFFRVQADDLICHALGLRQPAAL